MRRLLERKIGLFPGQRGFTLMEVLIAVGILAVIGVAFLTALNTSSKATRELDEKVQAANLATAYLEAIKASPYAATYPNAGSGITVPFQYNVSIKVVYSNNGGTTWVDSYTNETFEKITVIVLRGERPVLSVCTLRAKR